ncbi:MAG: C4-dicarboxylate transporter DctA [Pseudoxanthomonas sp.]
MQQAARKGLLRQLYIQVLIAIVIGGLLGYYGPEVGTRLQPLAEGFIKLIKMLLAPIIFGTVVVGIAKMGSVRDVGRTGIKALVYFEVLSTLALVLGLVVVNVLKPGVGMNIDAGTLDGGEISQYVQRAHEGGIVEFLLGIIPTTLVDAFAKGHMLQVILVSVLFAVGMLQLGERGKPLVEVIDTGLQALFRMINMVMRLAPIGAGAGVAYTIGKYGIGTLASLGQLMLGVYVTSAVFVFVILGAVARWTGFPLLRLLRFIKDEIFVTFGTCSTEAVLPRMMLKLEQAGVRKSTVGLVLPTGYTFNADGTSIYLAMAAVFVAQATNTPLPIYQQLVLMGVLLLTSKGSAGVAGAGFVALAATLSTLHTVPVAGLVLLLGVDRFMNEARAVVNLIGNAVATLAVAKWDGALDPAGPAEIIRRQRSGEPAPAALREP